MAPPGFVKMSRSGCSTGTFLLVFVSVAAAEGLGVDENDGDDASAKDCNMIVEGREFVTLVDKTLNLFSRFILIVST